MSNPAHFSAAEIFDLAIETEHNGKAFYEAAAQAASGPEVQKVMTHLANAEAEHARLFRDLKASASLSSASIPESYPGEQEENMQALLRARVLPDEATGLQVVRELVDDTAALDFAIAFEKDTILFMQQMKEMLPEAEREQISVLIAQEHGHIRALQQIKDRRS